MLGFFRDITYRKEMEEKLKESNQNFKLKLQELEKFEKMTVGRELKMVELKKRIKELEAKLK